MNRSAVNLGTLKEREKEGKRNKEARKRPRNENAEYAETSGRENEHFVHDNKHHR